MIGASLTQQPAPALRRLRRAGLTRSRRLSSSSRTRLAVLAACAAFLAGCATEGPPHPPRIQRPEAVQDLAVTQIGRTFILTFRAPTRAVDGRRLTKPIEVQFFRQIGKSGKTAAANMATARPWVGIAPDNLPRYERGGMVQYAATLTSEEFQRSTGETFEFMVRTLTRGFRRRPFPSDASNLAVIPLVDVSAPVQQLLAYSKPNAVELKWSAPSLTLTGKPVHDITGYRIYRSTTGKPHDFAAVGRSAGTSYADKNFVFGRTYYYTVRALFAAGHTFAQSAGSAPAVITPRDIFPPHAPQGLTAIYTGRAVELVWTPNLEPDLAGYNIYRREDDAAPEKLNSSLQPTAIYRDLTAQAGRHYLYWITAVDRSGNQSGPSTLVSVQTR